MEKMVKNKDGTKYWYRDGKLHREDGPACELADGINGLWWLDDELFRFF
jgi:hypothetical protein